MFRKKKEGWSQAAELERVDRKKEKRTPVGYGQMRILLVDDS